ncbi:MAG: hypothetical protein P0116_10025 [Candidatus Nitrosocosmicus sp.]|nr:hypothetical protein [Candidatus Nitrosocosmicus sp.]
MVIETFLFTGLINENPFFLNISAQELSKSATNSSNILSSKSDTTGNITMEQNDSNVIASVITMS